MQLRKLQALPLDVQVKTLCSVFAGILRVMITAEANSNSATSPAVDCLAVLLLDVLSNLDDAAPGLKDAEPSTAWCSVVQRLSRAQSEAALHGAGHHLTAVAKKLAQMQDVL